MLTYPPDEPQIPLCDPFKHQWQEEYYGYKCAVCAVFIPFGCEPWAPLVDEESLTEEKEPDPHAAA